MNLWTPVETADDLYIYDEKDREYPFVILPLDFDAEVRKIVDRHNNEVLASRAEIEAKKSPRLKYEGMGA